MRCPLPSWSAPVLALASRPGRASRSGARATLVLAAALATSAFAPPASAAGTWTKAPANTAAGGQAFGLWVLTDGTVLSHGDALNHWVVLTPDKKGSYANGTWKSVASSSHARGGAQQHMLKDGRFFQAGGEYVDGPACTPTLCLGTRDLRPRRRQVDGHGAGALGHRRHGQREPGGRPHPRQQPREQHDPDLRPGHEQVDGGADEPDRERRRERVGGPAERGRPRRGLPEARARRSTTRRRTSGSPRARSRAASTPATPGASRSCSTGACSFTG